MAGSRLTERPPRVSRPAPEHRAGGGHEPDRPSGLRNLAWRTLLGAATTLVSINLWTGGPLLAVWVGSRIQASVGSVSMAAVGATIGVLIVVSALLYQLLAWLSVRYNAAIGRKMKRPQAAWLKPMSGERRAVEVKQPLTAVEKIVMVSVVVAVEAFLVWFFFLAHYSLPG